METTPAPVTPPPAEAPRPRSYFNQGQLEDITLAESVLTAATANSEDVADRDIDAAFLAGFSGIIAEARSRSSRTMEDAADSEQATLESSKAAAELHTALQGIQSAAKQKHKMLATDGDPETNFPTDGYLIGTRLNSSRAILLQSADSLITRAKADNLPGYKKPEQIATLDALLAQYRDDKSAQQESTRTKELARLTRDDLMSTLNTRRSVIQHAADAIWPWSIEANRPTRKTFALPLTRSMGL